MLCCDECYMMRNMVVRKKNVHSGETQHSHEIQGDFIRFIIQLALNFGSLINSGKAKIFSVNSN